MELYGRAYDLLVVTNGERLNVGPWQEIDGPYALVGYGPVSIWIAWFVTDPLLFATGFAVAFACP